jgi:hypothetical protein
MSYGSYYTDDRKRTPQPSTPLKQMAQPKPGQRNLRIRFAFDVFPYDYNEDATLLDLPISLDDIEAILADNGRLPASLTDVVARLAIDRLNKTPIDGIRNQYAANWRVYEDGNINKTDILPGIVRGSIQLYANWDEGTTSVNKSIRGGVMSSEFDLPFI